MILGFTIKHEDGAIKGLRGKFTSKVLSLDAMRPEFQLGSLYNRRTDNLLPCFTLWKEESYKKDGFINERLARSQDWLIDSENTFSSKVGKLNIEAGLTLSLMGGMVDIKGHAKYFSDTISSSDIAKVSLTYRKTTIYKELTSHALYNPDYSDLLRDDEIKDEFTHVVTAIQYGGTCTMVFERKIKDNETKVSIEEALSVVLKSIPISEKDRWKVSWSEREKVENFKCTVYSDFNHNSNVSNWDEALSLYQSLPKKFSAFGKTDSEKGIPVKIWLLPKNMLGSQCNTLVKELSSVAVNRLREIIESLTEAINESRDLLNKMKNFPILNSKIDRFAKLVENYTATFQKDILSVLLVSIRSGTADEKLLFDAAKNHESSVFGYLNTWIERTKDEIDNLKAIKNESLPHLFSFPNNAFGQKIKEKATEVALTMKVCKREDKFIGEMRSYYNNLLAVKETASEKNILDILNEKKWFEDETFNEKMHAMAYKMRIFASANMMDNGIGFFVKHINCEETPDCYIEVWQNKIKLALKSFEPPTKVRDLRIKEYSHNTMKIKWNIPEKGVSNISSYKIKIFAVTNIYTGEGFDHRNQRILPTADETMTHVVSNLQPGQLYAVSVVCLCLNNYPSSDEMTLRQMTRLSAPPIDFNGQVEENGHIKLAWKKPSIKPENATLTSFLIEYKIINEKPWLNESVPSHRNDYFFLDLPYDTEYQFRIMACYDDEKQTLPSEVINLKTLKSEPCKLNINFTGRRPKL